MTLQVRHPVNGAVQASNAATFRESLPDNGALHSIIVKVNATNGSTAGRGVDITDVVDEIRVMADGTKQLFVLTPLEFEKWYETQNGKALQADRDEAADAVQEMVFPIMFGRELIDENMYLRLGAFNSVELQIDFSPTIAADAGFATGTVTFDVVLLITPEAEAGQYLGTLTTVEFRNFTSAASGDAVDEIDTRNPIRAIGIFAYEAAIADGVDLTRVRLRVNSGEFNLLDLDWDDFIIYNRELFGAEVEHFWNLFIQNNDTLDTHIGEILNVALQAQTAVDTSDDSFQRTVPDTIAGDRLTFDSGDVDITAASETITANAADVLVFCRVMGMSPSHFGLISFIGNDTPEDYLDRSQIGKLETVLTQGGAGADVRLAVQELQRF